MKKFISILLAGAAFSAGAQTYIGGSLGYGRTGENTESAYASPTLSIHQQTRSIAGSVFAGYRYGPIAIEGGLMKLPTYKASMYTSDYTAYLGQNIGIVTAYATDEVRANSVYIRANVHAGPAYVFAGLARTRSQQNTYGLYDGTIVGRAHYDTTNVKTMYGFGIQEQSGRITSRIEYVRIPGATENRAIGKRDVSMVLVGISYSF